MSKWDDEQETMGIPLIERTHKAIKPNGEQVEVNRFDYNLAFCADKNSYIQCLDKGWIMVANLTIVS